MPKPWKFPPNYPMNAGFYFDSNGKFYGASLETEEHRGNTINAEAAAGPPRWVPLSQSSQPIEAPQASQAQTDNPILSQSDSREHRRSRTGCQACRVKRKKCDETRPKCDRCVNAGTDCRWSSAIRFRHEDIAERSRRQSTPTNRAARRKHEIDKRVQIINEQSRTSERETDNPSGSSMPTPDPSQHDHPSSEAGERDADITDQDMTALQTSFCSEISGDTILMAPNTDLNLIRALPSIDPSRVTVPAEPIFSLDFESENGIFRPGTIYQELHQTLRTQIFQTTHADIPEDLAEHTTQQQDVEISSDGTLTPPSLEVDEEVMLWDNWVNEIGPWLDLFDQDKHHQHTLPSMAQNEAHLRYAMLALSARQIERKTGKLPYHTSLALYSHSIHLLLPLLHTKTLPVLASCVVLCVFEMSSCSPRAWRRHLDGCASLIMDMNIKGNQGGLEQALFWCFARMDLCGALISEEPTLIPYRSYYHPTVGTKGEPLRAQQYATYMCYLLSRTLAVMHGHKPSARRASTEPPVDYNTEWPVIYDELERWGANLPNRMEPVLRIAAQPEKRKHLFPTVAYSSGSAMSSNQLYHTAMLLLLQEKPREIKVAGKTALWHAREIIGISLSNSHHGAWINSVQPLYVAGKLMSHPVEHQAIRDLYRKIEAETGWGAMWRAADLRKHWGDLS